MRCVGIAVMDTVGWVVFVVVVVNRQPHRAADVSGLAGRHIS
jgi:hypothetical protein